MKVMNMDTAVRRPKVTNKDTLLDTLLDNIWQKLCYINDILVKGDDNITGGFMTGSYPKKKEEIGGFMTWPYEHAVDGKDYYGWLFDAQALDTFKCRIPHDFILKVDDSNKINRIDFIKSYNLFYKSKLLEKYFLDSTTLNDEWTIHSVNNVVVKSGDANHVTVINKKIWRTVVFKGINKKENIFTEMVSWLKQFGILIKYDKKYDEQSPEIKKYLLQIEGLAYTDNYVIQETTKEKIKESEKEKKKLRPPARHVAAAVVSDVVGGGSRNVSAATAAAVAVAFDTLPVGAKVARTVPLNRRKDKETAGLLAITGQKKAGKISKKDFKDRYKKFKVYSEERTYWSEFFLNKMNDILIELLNKFYKNGNAPNEINEFKENYNNLDYFEINRNNIKIIRDAEDIDESIDHQRYQNYEIKKKDLEEKINFSEYKINKPIGTAGADPLSKNLLTEFKKITNILVYGLDNYFKNIEVNKLPKIDDISENFSNLSDDIIISNVLSDPTSDNPEQRQRKKEIFLQKRTSLLISISNGIFLHDKINDPRRLNILDFEKEINSTELLNGKIKSKIFAEINKEQKEQKKEHEGITFYNKVQSIIDDYVKQLEEKSKVIRLTLKHQADLIILYFIKCKYSDHTYQDDMFPYVAQILNVLSDNDDYIKQIFKLDEDNIVKIINYFLKVKYTELFIKFGHKNDEVINTVKKKLNERYGVVKKNWFTYHQSKQSKKKETLVVADVFANTLVPGHLLYNHLFPTINEYSLDVVIPENNNGKPLEVEIENHIIGNIAAPPPYCNIKKVFLYVVKEGSDYLINYKLITEIEIVTNFFNETKIEGIYNSFSEVENIVLSDHIKHNLFIKSNIVKAMYFSDAKSYINKTLNRCIDYLPEYLYKIVKELHNIKDNNSWWKCFKITIDKKNICNIVINLGVINQKDTKFFISDKYDKYFNSDDYLIIGSDSQNTINILKSKNEIKEISFKCKYTQFDVSDIILKDPKFFNELYYTVEIENDEKNDFFYFVGDTFRDIKTNRNYKISSISEENEVIYDINNKFSDREGFISKFQAFGESLPGIRNFQNKNAKQKISKITSKYYFKEYNFNTIFDINLNANDYDKNNECALKHKSAVELFIKFAGILVKLLEYYIPLLSKKPTVKQKEVDDYVDSMYIQHFEVRFRTFFENDNKGNENIKAKYSEQIDNINKKLLSFFDEKGKLKYDTKYTANQGADPITILFTLCNIGIERLLEGSGSEDRYTMHDNPYKSKINAAGMECMDFIDFDDGFNNSMILDKLTSEKSVISSLISKFKGKKSYLGFGKMTREKRGGSADRVVDPREAAVGVAGVAIELRSPNTAAPATTAPATTEVAPVEGEGAAEGEASQLEHDGVEGDEESPVEESPVEDPPVEESPVEESPVEDPPVEESPVEFEGEGAEEGVSEVLAPIFEIIGVSSFPFNPIALIVFLIFAYKTLKTSRDIYIFLINIVGIAIFSEINDRKLRLSNKLKILLYGLDKLNFLDDTRLVSVNTRYKKGDPYTIDGAPYTKWRDDLISLPGRLSMYEYRKFIVDSYSIDNTNNKLINVIVLEHKFKNPQIIYIPKKYNSFFENSYKSDVKVCIYENKYCKIFAHITEKLRPEVETSLKNKIIRETKRVTKYQKSKIIPGISTRVLNTRDTKEHKNKWLPGRGFAYMKEKTGYEEKINHSHTENQNLLVKDIIKSCKIRNKRICDDGTFIELYLKKHKIDIYEDYNLEINELKKKIKNKINDLKPNIIGGNFLRNKKLGGAKKNTKKGMNIKKDIINKLKKEIYYYDYTSEVKSLYFYVNEHMLHNPDEKREDKKRDYSVTPISGFEFVRVDNKNPNRMNNDDYVHNIMNILKKTNNNIDDTYSNLKTYDILITAVNDKIRQRRDDLRRIALPPLIDTPEQIKNNNKKGELWKLVQYLIGDVRNNSDVRNNDAISFFYKNFRLFNEQDRIDILGGISANDLTQTFNEKVKESVVNACKTAAVAAKSPPSDDVAFLTRTDEPPQPPYKQPQKKDILNKIAFLFDICILVKLEDNDVDWEVYDPRMYYITVTNDDFNRKYDYWMKEVTGDISKTYINIEMSGFYKDVRQHGEQLSKRPTAFITKETKSSNPVSSTGTHSLGSDSRYTAILNLIQESLTGPSVSGL